jgi:hypothetical protein
MPSFAFGTLSNPQYVKTPKIRIFRPDGLLYKTFTGGQADGEADFASLPTSKGLDKNVTEVNRILNIDLPDRLIYSRQMVSWPAEISVDAWDGSSNVNTVLYKGVVTSGSISGVFAKLEISNTASLLNNKPPVNLSNNCPLVFGSPACGAVKTGFWVSPLGISGQAFLIPNTAFTPSPGAIYEATVGDFSYRVVSLNTPTPGFINTVFCEAVPAALPDWVFISTTCSQTLQQCRRYNNEAAYRGSVLPRSPLATR